MAHKNQGGRFIWYVLVLLPIAVLIAINTKEILHWFQTGHCPGGPMDRVSAPCGPIDLIRIVFLGGWVAFIVVPILVGYWICLLVAFAVIRDLTARRREPR
jgi:hypothetical protein